MKKWIIRLVIICFVLLIVGLVAVFFSMNSLVKRGVEKVGPMITQTSVKLDSANISPFSGSGQLHGLVVGNPSGYNTPSAIKVGDIKVAVEVKSVFSSVVVVDSFVMEAPEVTLEGGIGGNNLSKLLDNISSVAGADEGTTSTAQKPAEGGKKFRVKDILIKGTKVNASLTGMGGKTVTRTLPDIHLTNIGTDGDGVSSAELSKKVVREILASTIKDLSSSTGLLGKEVQGLGKGAATQVEKASKSLKGLFNK
ncbi:MAG: uncharacterized protein JWM68_5570 [Verrucomicrobiales bacterium]|nr:uncharacterized protein [Verrucomicrobiales bacterium]